MKKIVLFAAIAFFAIINQTMAQNNDTIWFKNKTVIACKIIYFDNQYINYDTDTDAATFLVTSRDSVIKFSKNSALTIQPVKQKVELTTNIQKAGKELKIASNNFYMGMGLVFVGSGITTIGFIVKHREFTPSGVVSKEITGSVPVQILGALTMTVGVIMNFSSFSHIGKAGKLLLNENGVGVALTF